MSRSPTLLLVVLLALAAALLPQGRAYKFDVYGDHAVGCEEEDDRLLQMPPFDTFAEFELAVNEQKRAARERASAANAPASTSIAQLLKQARSWLAGLFSSKSKTTRGATGAGPAARRADNRTDAQKMADALSWVEEKAMHDTLSHNWNQGYSTTLGTVDVALELPDNKKQFPQVFRVRSKPHTPEKKVNSVIFAVRRFAEQTAVPVHDLVVTLQNERGELRSPRQLTPEQEEADPDAAKVDQQFLFPKGIVLNYDFPKSTIEYDMLHGAKPFAQFPDDIDQQIVLAAIHELCHYAHSKADKVKYAACFCKVKPRVFISVYSRNNVCEWVAEVCVAKFFGWPYNSIARFKRVRSEDVERLYAAFGGFDVSKKSEKPRDLDEKSEKPRDLDEKETPEDDPEKPPKRRRRKEKAREDRSFL